MGHILGPSEMVTAEDRLKFAVQFVRMPLDQLRPWEWMKLREDLQAFLTRGTDTQQSIIRPGILALPVRPPLPADYPEDKFQALQREVRAVLEALVPEDGTQGSHDSRHIPIPAGYAFTPLPGFGGRGLLTVQGATRDLFLLVLFLLLVQEGAGRVMRCPECGQLFFRVRRQKYCGRPCVNRANMREYRKREAAKRRRIRRVRK